MEKQNKTLLFSVILSVFLTTFIVSAGMFFWLYKTKSISVNSSKSLRACPEISRICSDGIIATRIDLETCETICSNDNEKVNSNNTQNSNDNKLICPAITRICEDGKSATYEQGTCNQTCLEDTVKKEELNNNVEIKEDLITIPKGAVDWQEPKEVGDRGYLKDMEDDSCVGDVKTKYYLNGKINSGIYKGIDLYTAMKPDCGMGIYYTSYKVLIDQNNQIIFFKGYDKFKDYEIESLKESFLDNTKKIVIDENIIIEDLVLPEKIKTGKVSLFDKNYTDSYFSDDAFSILKEAFVFEYGKVWTTDEIKSDKIADQYKNQNKSQNFYDKYGIYSTNAFYIKAKDGFLVTYKLDFSSTLKNTEISNTDYRTGELTILLNNGQKQTESYQFSPGGCGTSHYAFDYTNTINLSELVIIGKFENGDPAYTFKSVNNPEFQDFYNKDYQSNNKISQEEFLKGNHQIFWIDPFNRILSFISTDIVPPAECAKPVIYLYPEKTTDIQVQVFPNQGFTVTDPVYPKNGWLVKATPESVLTNKTDGKEYPYLFWEGKSDELYFRSDKGFVVSQNDLDNFFNEKLAKLGLNEKEINDFKEFWIPKMKEENKNFYFITFASQNFINKAAPLKISPKPDSMIRVLMDYEGLDEYKEVEELPIVTPKRNGFTVVEWGGMLQ